jgi:hypothetical protein
MSTDYLRGYATAVIDAIAAIQYANQAQGESDPAWDGMNAAVSVLKNMRPPRTTPVTAGEPFPVYEARMAVPICVFPTTGAACDT